MYASRAALASAAAIRAKKFTATLVNRLTITPTTPRTPSSGTNGALDTLLGVGAGPALSPSPASVLRRQRDSARAGCSRSTSVAVPALRHPVGDVDRVVPEKQVPLVVDARRVVAVVAGHLVVRERSADRPTEREPMRADGDAVDAPDATVSGPAVASGPDPARAEDRAARGNGAVLVDLGPEALFQGRRDVVRRSTAARPGAGVAGGLVSVGHRSALRGHESLGLGIRIGSGIVLREHGRRSVPMGLAEGEKVRAVSRAFECVLARFDLASIHRTAERSISADRAKQPALRVGMVRALRPVVYVDAFGVLRNVEPSALDRLPFASAGPTGVAAEKESLAHPVLQTRRPASGLWPKTGHEKPAPQQPSPGLYAYG